jgi:hypothetical protein
MAPADWQFHRGCWLSFAVDLQVAPQNHEGADARADPAGALASMINLAITPPMKPTTTVPMSPNMDASS